MSLTLTSHYACTLHGHVDDIDSHLSTDLEGIDLMEPS